jgi:Zn finger protein HypA/HybF involved in hydrogenase expression
MTLKKIYNPQKNDLLEDVFDCPDCKAEIEDISDVAWSNYSIYRCPKCHEHFTLVDGNEGFEFGIIRGQYTDG